MTSGGDGESRRRDAAATRAALLQAAMRRFTAVGFERATVRDIARDAGVNVSLISRYFGSKQGLFATVLEQSVEAVAEGRVIEHGHLVNRLCEGLRPDAWPDFGGEHPLLLMLRGDADDDVVRQLRERSVRTALLVLGRALQADGGRPESAEAVLAMVVGILAIRAVLPDGLLASMPEAEMSELMQSVVDAAVALGQETSTSSSV